MTCNTNIMDKNDVSLGAWFEATSEYGKCRELGVSGPTVSTIESDLALYVEEHDINDFGDIPEAELVAAIADNTDARTRLRTLWEFEGAELDGYVARDDCWSGIDRDQAVDDDGKAMYDRYELSVDVSAPDESVPDRRIYRFTATDIEDFARTW